MDSDWTYRVYQNKGQRSLALGVMSLSRFSKKSKCISLNFYVCGPTSMKLLPHFLSKVMKGSGRIVAKGPLLKELCPLLGFQILPFLKFFETDFSGTKKARKLKVRIKMNNNWMYCVYKNKGQRTITLGVKSLGRFSKN